MLRGVTTKVPEILDRVVGAMFTVDYNLDKGKTTRDGLMTLRRIDSIQREYAASLGACSGDAKYDALIESVRRDGIREAITLDASGMILDGHHRLAVAVELGLELVPVRIWTGTDYVE